MSAEEMPVSTGETNQESTMGTTPLTGGNGRRSPGMRGTSCDQTTASTPPYTTAKPMMAPMMLCVADTFISKHEATICQTPPTNSATIMPYANTSGSRWKTAGSAMLPAIVSVMTRPSTSAPANSKTMAMMTACFIVSVREPTLVPKALPAQAVSPGYASASAAREGQREYAQRRARGHAPTSFAPVPNPKMKALTAPSCCVGQIRAR